MGGIAHDGFGIRWRAEKTRGCPGEMALRGVEMGEEGVSRGEPFAVDVPAAGADQRIEQAGAFWIEGFRERRGDFVRPDGGAGGDLFQRIAPPLEAHFGDQGFFREVRRAGDLDRECMEREEHAARRRRRGHDRGEAVRVALGNAVCAGLKRHGAAMERA